MKASVYRVKVSTPGLRAGSLVTIDPLDFPNEIKANYLRPATEEELERHGVIPQPPTETRAEGQEVHDAGVYGESASAPPRNGSRQHWVAYAEEIGLTVNFNMSRSDIIDMVDSIES